MLTFQVETKASNIGMVFALFAVFNAGMSYQRRTRLTRGWVSFGDCVEMHQQTLDALCAVSGLFAPLPTPCFPDVDRWQDKRRVDDTLLTK